MHLFHLTIFFFIVKLYIFIFFAYSICIYIHRNNHRIDLIYIIFIFLCVDLSKVKGNEKHSVRLLFLHIRKFIDV
ncbi:hypothetical protein C2G38_2119255 [Gigaspora rosea]|uniref:Uncharacterized protein n=1 Tax=Gigaspora rosea TaxID=44941 RepID=A0A397U465_9GLOM|nr:hypothetical protein C2G38_2119255 [Gigaspora rosea]